MLFNVLIIFICVGVQKFDMYDATYASIWPFSFRFIYTTFMLPAINARKFQRSLMIRILNFTTWITANLALVLLIPSPGFTAAVCAPIARMFHQRRE